MPRAAPAVETLPDGVHTIMGERGVKLSPRPAAAHRDRPRVLEERADPLLDEATSALDSESEEAVREALDRLMAGRTVIAIAHRLSTLRSFDRIVVLQAGRVVEDGSPGGLMRGDGIYRDLVRREVSRLNGGVTVVASAARSASHCKRNRLSPRHMIREVSEAVLGEIEPAPQVRSVSRGRSEQARQKAHERPRRRRERDGRSPDRVRRCLEPILDPQAGESDRQGRPLHREVVWVFRRMRELFLLPSEACGHRCRTRSADRVPGWSCVRPNCVFIASGAVVT